MIDVTKQLKNELKGDNMNTLKEKVIDEVMTILNEVKDVQKLMSEFNINISSDTWIATNIERNKVPNYNENILNWNRRDFEQIDLKRGDSFFIGGNITTGHEHQFKDKWIIAPKKLAEVQGEIVKEYLESIIDNQQCQYLDLSFYDPYGLTDNCGWEHYMCIKATVNCDIKTDERTKALLNKIMQEGDHIIELSGCPVNEEPNNMFSEETGLQPQGDFAYMVEFFSFDLVDADDNKYQGAYGLNDEYIKDALILTKKVQFRAESLRQDYAHKGVQVTINGFNDGCQGGLAVYVWIPYQ